MVSSTSLALIKPVSQGLKRRSTNARRGLLGDSQGFRPGLPATQDEFIDAEFSEVFEDIVNLPPANGNGYDDVLLPKFLLKRRHVNYYA